MPFGTKRRRYIILSLKKTSKGCPNRCRSYLGRSWAGVGDALGLAQAHEMWAGIHILQVRGSSWCDREIPLKYNKNSKILGEKVKNGLSRSYVRREGGHSGNHFKILLALLLTPAKAAHPLPCKLWLALHRLGGQCLALGWSLPHSHFLGTHFRIQPCKNSEV